MRTRFVSAIAAGTVIAFSLACEGRTSGFLVSEPTSGARVRLVNALTSAQTLDFLVDGQVAASAVAFGAASPYAPVSAGSRRLQARATGSGTTLVDFTRDVTDGAFSLIPAPGLSQFGALFIADNPTPVTGQARIRAVHVAAAPGAVSVFLTAPSGDVTSASPTVPSLSFGSASDYVQVAPGTYRVRVTRAGSPSEIVVDLGDVTLGAGSVRTFLVTDAPGGGLPTNLSIVSDAN